MPCCAAAHCFNREVGARLFRFPKNLERREIWRVFCSRGDWQPTNNHKLCEAHFEEDQYFEQAFTTKGNRKLKPAAIPTILTTQSDEKSLNSRQLRRSRKLNKPKTTTDTKKASARTKLQPAEVPKLPDYACDLSHVQQQQQTKKNVLMLVLPNGPNNKKLGIVLKGPKDLERVKQLYKDKPFPAFRHIKMKVNKFNEIRSRISKLKLSELINETNSTNYKSSFIKRRKIQIKLNNQHGDSVYKRKLQLMMVRNNQLRKKLAETNQRLFVQNQKLLRFLSLDQLHILNASSKVRPAWTDEMMMKSVEILEMCGRKGYKYLFGNGYPLIPYRQLVKSLQKTPSEENIFECNVEITEDNDEVETLGLDTNNYCSVKEEPLSSSSIDNCVNENNLYSEFKCEN